VALSALIVLAVIVAFVLLLLAKTVRVIPQARAGVVERLGRYSRTLTPGLTLVIPFIDRVKPLLDLREQAVTFEPQPVITEDNLVVNIDTVIYFQVTDAKAATYEIADRIHAIEQLTVTTLRNVIGGIALERTLTSRDHINTQLRGVLDEATGKWGIRVNRVYAATFGIGAMMAGACGSVMAMVYPITSSMTDQFLGKAFVVCVIGGLGSVPGALAGGLLIGFVEALSARHNAIAVTLDHRRRAAGQIPERVSKVGVVAVLESLPGKVSVAVEGNLAQQEIAERVGSVASDRVS